MIITLLISILFCCTCKKEVNCERDGVINPSVFLSNIRNQELSNKESCILVYKKGNDFSKELAKKELMHYTSNNSDGIHLDFGIEDHPLLGNTLSCIYDYRVILNDSIYFDISDIKLANDTMGHGMTNWAIRCNIISYKVNDSLIIEDLSDILVLPYSSKKIVNKQ